jgi:hypothetical protein
MQNAIAAKNSASVVAFSWWVVDVLDYLLGASETEHLIVTAIRRSLTTV